MAFNNTLKKIKKNKDIIIVCACDDGATADITLSKLGYKIVGYADNSEKKQGKKYNKKNVLSLPKATEKYPTVQYIIAVEKYEDELKEQLIKLGINQDNIICLDLYSILELKTMFPTIWKSYDKNYLYSFPKKRGIKLFGQQIRNYISSRCWKLKFKRIKKTSFKRKKYYSAICAIFKNESNYLDEWICYYKKIGLDHLYLYNNKSSDDYMRILLPFISEGFVTLIDWPYEQGQMSAYRDCISKFGNETNWLGFIDLDEFVTPIRYGKINETLEKYERYASLWIPELLYGSSSLKERDIRQSVLKSFTFCWPKHTNTGKCFLNTEYNIDEKRSNNIFNHYIWAEKQGKSYPSVNPFGQVCFLNYFRAKNEEFPIDLKHYAIKSQQEYQEKKEKTDAFFKKNMHTDNAFFYHDYRSIRENKEMIDFMDNVLDK